LTAKDDERETSSAMLRALELLEKIASAGRPLTLAEICAIVNLPKPTAHRLCQRLEAEHFLAREPGGRHYAIGPRLVKIGLNSIRWSGNTDRHMILEKLVQQIGETCNFTALVGGEVLYLDRVEARWPLRLHLEPGSRVPMHCTASGKLFLAFMTEARRRKTLENLELPAFTQHTLVSSEALDIECLAVRERGYSLDREEFLLGLFAIAVPVLDADGNVIAAIACHGPSARFDVEKALAFLPQFKAAAQNMRSTLDY
jgi:DNA-binding IclR family transcriptional regulator